MNEFMLRSEYVNSTQLCASIGQKNDIVKMLPCIATKSMQWRIDDRGMIWSKIYPRYCLSLKNQKDDMLKNSNLGLVTPCDNSWLRTQDGLMRYSASPFVLDFDESSPDKELRLWPLVDKRQTSRWLLSAS